MAIEDLAHNALSTPATEPMLGYTEPAPAAEVLTLDMYDFLIEPIREEDRKNGNLFVKRLLQGSQTVWLENTARIFALKDLWSVIDCPDELLRYLKNIVGWTQEPITKRITDALDADALRRLIAVSAALWKRRGTEPSIVEFLSFLTGQRLRIWNWFDLRWILGEAELTWDNLRADSWVTGSPRGAENDERRFNVRIVDPGILDRVLVRNVVNLMRACGERVEISYISFLDLFTIENDDSQWSQKAGTSLAVTGGVLALSDDTGAERSVVEVAGSYDWADYMVFSRIKAAVPTPGAEAGLLFYYTDESNYYSATLDIANDKLKVDKIVAGTPTNIADVALRFIFGDLQPDLYYMLRVTVVLDSGTNRIKVHIDGTEVAEVTDSALTKGTIGLMHDTGASLEADEVEASLLPMTTEEVGTNY